MDEPVTSVAHYRVKRGCEEEFLEIIDRHWIILRELELVAERDVEVYLGFEQGIDGPLVIEIFDWVDEDASGRAHTHPDVSGVWEAMGPLCEARGGRPAFEFYDGRRIKNP